MAAPTPRHPQNNSQRKRLIAAALTAAALMTHLAPAAAGSDIFGTWLRDDGNARVRVAPCGGAICATNLWIRDPQKLKPGQQLTIP